MSKLLLQPPRGRKRRRCTLDDTSILASHASICDLCKKPILKGHLITLKRYGLAEHFDCDSPQVLDHECKPCEGLGVDPVAGKCRYCKGIGFVSLR